MNLITESTPRIIITGSSKVVAKMWSKWFITPVSTTNFSMDARQCIFRNLKWKIVSRVKCHHNFLLFNVSRWKFYASARATIRRIANSREFHWNFYLKWKSLVWISEITSRCFFLFLFVWFLKNARGSGNSGAFGIAPWISRYFEIFSWEFGKVKFERT